MYRTNSEVVTRVHKSLLANLLSFCESHNIHDWKGIQESRIKEVFDQPLWKLLELEGKYVKDYVSEGVVSIEDNTGQPVNPNSGRWTDDDLRRAFPELANVQEPSKEKAFKCQLEHVNSRRLLVESLLLKRITLDELVEKHLIGCVVTLAEHTRLRTKHESLDDPWLKYRKADPPVRVWSRANQEWLF
ncbi:hypothetical protein KQ306_04610 [Synechococcus sp. CS-1324]|uniref:hypothetical protein n=1 Tax=Synechococcus sp. CS-1324 TaxID=2847980 RepID=UPI00223BB0D1|nr:hypothetical protein [Synechococcus sp. CS-1324]MCT0230143.1 hypothetical protein [Synechococcus sp. CS-1324]